MASANFEVVRRKSDNTITKLRGQISEKKEINITVLNGNAYVHFSDLKNVKDGAKFTKNNTKNISFNMDEIAVLRSYFLDMDQQVWEFLKQTEAPETSNPYQPETVAVSPPAPPVPSMQPMPWGAPAPYQMPQQPGYAQAWGNIPQQYGMPQPQQQQAYGIPQQAYGQPQQQQAYGMSYDTVYDRTWTDGQGVNWVGDADGLDTKN